MRKLAPGILLVSALLATPPAWADEPMDQNPIPEAIRDDVKPLGFGLGLGTLAFSFAGVPVHVAHSIATIDASTTVTQAGPDVVLFRTGQIHRVSAALAAVRALPITASLIGLGLASDDTGLLHSLGLPYLVLGAYDVISAGISGVNAIRLYEDRTAATTGWTGPARIVADASIEAGGAWGGGMLAVGTIELIVGGLALHGAHRLEAQSGPMAISVLLLPAPGGALLVGRF